MSNNNTKTGAKLEVHTRIKNALLEKEYNIEYVKQIKLVRSYPPFKGENTEEDMSYEAPVKAPSTCKQKTLESKQEENNKQMNKESIKKRVSIQPNPIPDEIKSKIDPSIFTKEELENPDVVENLVSKRVLDIKIKRVNDAIQKIEGRAPPDLRKRFLSLKHKKNIIEKGITEGEINAQQYLDMMKKQYERDRLLAAYLDSIGEKEKAKLVNERVSLLMMEIDEGNKHLNLKK